MKILYAKGGKMFKKPLEKIFVFFVFIGLWLGLFVLLPKACPAEKRYPSRSYYTDAFIKGPFLRLGFGYGIPYGYLGLNGEYMLFDYFSITGGLGFSPGGAGWIMGIRIYMNEPSRRIRPRISALYGTVSVLSKRYGPEQTYENDQGYAYGLGFEWKFLDSGKHSLDFDLIMTDYDVPPGYEKKGPSIKFSIGYGRVF